MRRRKTSPIELPRAVAKAMARLRRAQRQYDVEERMRRVEAELEEVRRLDESESAAVSAVGKH